MSRPDVPHRHRALATALLFAATAVWGATFVTVKEALAGADTFTFLALRFGIGAIAAALLSLVQAPQRNWASWSGVLRPGLSLGMLLYGGYALQTLGLETTTPARSAFITGLTVIFVPFVSWGLSGKRPALRSFVAPVLALVGLGQLTQVSLSQAIPVGDALTLGCAVLYACHIAATSRWAEGLPPMPLTAVQLAMVAGLSTASLPLVERRFEPTVGFWGAVVFTGVVASAWAIGVQVWAQTRMTAMRAAVIYALEPVFALAWAAMIGLDAPTREELTGGAVIVGAVLLSEVQWR